MTAPTRIAKQNKNLPKGLISQESARITPGKSYNLQPPFMVLGAKYDRSLVSVMDDDGWVINMSRKRFRK